MDESRIQSVIALIVLIPAYALLTFAVSVLVNNRYAEETEERGRLNRTQQTLSLILLFAIAALATYTFVTPLAATLQSSVLAYLVVMIPLALLVLIFGETIPNTLGRIHGARFDATLRMLLLPAVIVLRPITWLMSQVTRGLLALSGSHNMDTSITEEELLELIDAGQSLEEDERKMIHNVLELDQTTVTEIMIPRIDIVAVDKTTSIAEARKVFLEGGHSRMPVYEGNIDHIVGLVYVKDLLEVWHNGDTVVESVAEIMRSAYFVPRTMTADLLLREFKLQKVHLLIVVEEYGGTGGLVTLEDLMEEIVGDIQDEYDEHEIEEILQVSDTEYRVDAGVTLDDLNDALEVELEDDDVDTLGGYIFNMLERVPEPGEVITLDELEIRVVVVDGRRIREVHVTKQELPDEEEVADEPGSNDEEAEGSSEFIA
ncbi:MAG: hemolysin family protein [Chloroflexota bacterium]